MLGATVVGQKGTGAVLTRSRRLGRCRGEVGQRERRRSGLLSHFGFLHGSAVLVLTLVLLVVPLLKCMVCVGLQIGGGGGRLRSGGRLMRTRGRRLTIGGDRVRGVSGRGLRFFAGVSRRVHAPLALVLKPIGGLVGGSGLSPSVRRSITLVGQGMSQLCEVIGRVLSFQEVSGSGVGLVLHRMSLVKVMERIFSCFANVTRRGRVRCQFSAGVSRLGVCVSIGGVRRILMGVVSGTFGCSSDKKSVSIQVANRTRAILLRIRSRKQKVSGRDVRRLFRHFCANGGAFNAMNFNVKLGLSGRCISLRSNRVHTRDRPKRCALFDIQLCGSVARCARRCVLRRASHFGLDCRSVRISAAIIGRVLSGACSCRILIIRSSPSMQCDLQGRLSTGFRMRITNGNGRTLSLLKRNSTFRLVLDSMLVPNVGKFRLIGQIGGSLTFDRVPVVLLATLSRSDRHVCNVTRKTSRCVPGPFGVSFLGVHVVGVVSRQRGVGRTCVGGLQTNAVSGIRMYGLVGMSRLFESGLLDVISARCRGSSFDVRSLDRRLKLSEIRLCQGVGALFKISPASCLEGCQLGGTVLLLGTQRCGVDRVTCVANFASPTCFAGYFHALCKIAPARTVITG